MKKISTFLLPILCFGCSADQSNGSQKIPAATTITYPTQPLSILGDEEESLGADVRLSLIEITSTDSICIYKAMSSYDGKNVGLEVILPHKKAEKESSPTQIMEIKTLGTSSDNLLVLLSKLYKLKVDTGEPFISSVKPTFVDLNEFARAKFGKEAIPSSDEKDMKLFFEAEDPEDYAELYININEKAHWLEIREKDEGYRKQVIKFFTAK
jgi:hypothetical protein